MSYYVLFSGMLGALIGSGVSLYIARKKEWLVARSKLGGILFQIAYDLQYSEKLTEDILRPNYVALWIGGRDAAALVFISSKRNGIEAKTDLLCGSIKGIMDDRSESVATHSFPKRDNAKKHAEEFLRLLDYQ